MDPSLVIHQFHPSVEKQPLNTHYQSYEADSADQSNVSWNIDSPFAGALLDNEVWIEYIVGFNYSPTSGGVLATDDFRDMFEGGPTNVGLNMDAYPCRFRAAAGSLQDSQAAQGDHRKKLWTDVVPVLRKLLCLTPRMGRGLVGRGVSPWELSHLGA